MLSILLFPLAALALVSPRFHNATHHGYSRPPHPSSVTHNLTTTRITTVPSITAIVETSTVTASSTSTASTAPTIAPYGSFVKPKILFIANTFEFGYLTGYTFTTQYTGALLNETFSCTMDGETCMLACGQELVSAAQITALLLIPGIDLIQTYVFITGTGGVNPKYGTAGGVAISTFSVQWEWGGMFLGSDLPANFSGQYFYAYGQDEPDKYPSLVGTEVYQLNQALVDRFYNLAQVLVFEDVTTTLQALRKTYLFSAAQRAPFLAQCDVVSAQVYWHGDVAGQNVEYYANLTTSGAAKPCNTNEDDQGRFVALVNGAQYAKLDFGRVVLIKAFSNFDRPPPQLTAF